MQKHLHKESLYVHCRQFHDTDIISVKPFQCKYCDIQFSTEKTLTVHINNFVIYRDQWYF